MEPWWYSTLEGRSRLHPFVKTHLTRHDCDMCHTTDRYKTCKMITVVSITWMRLAPVRIPCINTSSSDTPFDTKYCQVVAWKELICRDHSDSFIAKNEYSTVWKYRDKSFVKYSLKMIEVERPWTIMDSELTMNLIAIIICRLQKSYWCLAIVC